MDTAISSLMHKIPKLSSTLKNIAAFAARF